MDNDRNSLYNKCKIEVKAWETNFTKNHGRVPSKLDIREADKVVRDAYRTYFKLKTEALEKSFKDVEGFNSDDESMYTSESCNNIENICKDDTLSEYLSCEDTWGSHLNKKVEEKKEDNKVKSNTELTKKLFIGSKLTSKLFKRNPRKPLSQTKSESSLNISEIENDRSVFLSQPSNSTNTNDSLKEHILFDNSKVSILSNKHEKLSLQSTNILQSVLDNKYRSLKSCDIGWLNRIETNTNFKPEEKTSCEATKLNELSDESVIEASDEEIESTFLHTAKKIKLDFENKSAFISNLSNAKTFSNSENFSSLDKPTEVIDESLKYSQIVVQEVDAGKINENESLASTRLDIPKTNISNIDKDVAYLDNASETLKDYSNGKKKNLNENFLKININKKVYVRGKKTMNFSKYKKQQWKNKKKFNTDFMKEKRKLHGDCLLPMEAVEDIEEDVHLTLEQVEDQDNKLLRRGNISKSKDTFDEVEKRSPVCDSSEDDDESIPLSLLKEQLNLNKNTSVKSILQTKTKVPKPHNKKSYSGTGNETRKIKEKVTAKVKKKKEDKVKGKIEKNKVKEISRREEDYDFNDDFTDDLVLASLQLENYLGTIGVQSLYNLNNDGGIIATPKEVFEALTLFGHSSFRPGQEEAIMRIMSGKSTLVTLSTGCGKSLCYQLPAYLYRKKQKCITLVISPLVSLMEDQVKCIPKCLKAVCLHTGQTKSQKKNIIEALEGSDVDVLLISPEAVVYGEKSGFGSIIKRLPPVAFACLDEAHCLSQWSHNFRPSYLVICRILQESLGVKTILGLTATATKATIDSLIGQIKLPDGEKGVIKDIPIPDNLILTVSQDEDKDYALLGLLQTEDFSNYESVIVYCTRRNECERIATFLRTCLKSAQDFNPKKRKRMNFKAESYHAGLWASKRKSIQNAFMSGQLKIVVATIAFGMGINKADIRSVIHYNMPPNFESYVQEIGRAGRDGLPAHCHVFLDKQNSDRDEHMRHIYADSIDRHSIRKLLKKVFISCSCKDTCVKHEVLFPIDETVEELDVPKENISTLLCYLELNEHSYVKTLKNSYTRCKITSYGGYSQILKGAETCEVLKMALKMFGKLERDNTNIFEFPIIDAANSIKWDTGKCKHDLKNLEWNVVNSQSKRSMLTVQFTELGFHLLTTGNLRDSELDEALDNLHNRVQTQEKTAYSQLVHLHESLKQVACSSFQTAFLKKDENGSILKNNARNYFDSSVTLKDLPDPVLNPGDEEMLLGAIRNLVGSYSDTNFTGRSIARIFHGIGSPNFAPYSWGRCKFWRKYLHIHFNLICKVATRELINLHTGLR